MSAHLPIPALLIRKRDDRGVVLSCFGIDLAEVGPAPHGHGLWAETDLADADALPGEVFQTRDGQRFEVLEGVRDIVVADGVEPRVVFRARPKSDVAATMIAAGVSSVSPEAGVVA